MNKFLMAGALLLLPLSAHASSTWTKAETTTPFGNVVNVWTAQLTSATAETSALTVSSRSCLTIDHISNDASRTVTIKGAPQVTGGISVTDVAGVTPTANVGVHTTVAGQARRVWATGQYAVNANGITSFTVTDVQNCQR